jgi:hypothetical protein
MNIAPEDRGGMVVITIAMAALWGLVLGLSLAMTPAERRVSARFGDAAGEWLLAEFATFRGAWGARGVK